MRQHVPSFCGAFLATFWTLIYLQELELENGARHAAISPHLAEHFLQELELENGARHATTSPHLAEHFLQELELENGARDAAT